MTLFTFLNVKKEIFMYYVEMNRELSEFDNHRKDKNCV